MSIKSFLKGLEEKGSALEKVADASLKAETVKLRITSIDVANGAKAKLIEFFEKEVERVHAETEKIHADLDAILAKL